MGHVNYGCGRCSGVVVKNVCLLQAWRKPGGYVKDMLLLIYITCPHFLLRLRGINHSHTWHGPLHTIMYHNTTNSYLSIQHRQCRDANSHTLSLSLSLSLSHLLVRCGCSRSDADGDFTLLQESWSDLWEWHTKNENTWKMRIILLRSIIVRLCENWLNV